MPIRQTGEPLLVRNQDRSIPRLCRNIALYASSSSVTGSGASPETASAPYSCIHQLRNPLSSASLRNTARATISKRYSSRLTERDGVLLRALDARKLLWYYGGALRSACA